MAEQSFRIILHIDLNAFFASCEIMLKPELEALPVVVVGSKSSKRGVVTTANYVARNYGIHSAMSLAQAKRKCPHLTVLKGNMDLYRRVSKQFMRILSQYSQLIEPASIDEAYMDVTHHFPQSDPLVIAQKIQAHIYHELRIGCSIGVAPNKFLAKMASDMEKPHGLTILRKRDLAHTLWLLPVEKMHGIGKSSAPKLKRLGINTIGELANVKENKKIEQLFGPHGLDWIKKAKGDDDRPIDPNRYDQPSSIGHSTTFPRDYSFDDEIKTELKQMCTKTANRLQLYSLYAKTITLQLKDTNFKQVSRSMSVEIPIQTENELFQMVEELFEEYWNGVPVRLVGVSTSNLVNSKKVIKQLNLFNYQSFVSEEKLSQTIQQLPQK